MTTEELTAILTHAKNIAVVGLSADPNRPSHQVAKYLITQGYRVLPVNPHCTQVLGLTCFSDLISAKQALPIGETIDIVDIFRKSELVLTHVEEAIKIGAKVIWMQEGIVNEAAAQRARAAGLRVIMDLCLMKTSGHLQPK